MINISYQFNLENYSRVKKLSDNDFHTFIAFITWLLFLGLYSVNSFLEEGLSYLHAITLVGIVGMENITWRLTSIKKN